MGRELRPSSSRSISRLMARFKYTESAFEFYLLAGLLTGL
jgi:hypothetical protein